jgi:hypothetical protein
MMRSLGAGGSKGCDLGTEPNPAGSQLETEVLPRAVARASSRG